MLAHLQIRDLAVIDAAELELAAGLTALTGETGAGKSIVVDAVMLALGGRASAENRTCASSVPRTTTSPPAWSATSRSSPPRRSGTESPSAL